MNHRVERINVDAFSTLVNRVEFVCLCGWRKTNSEHNIVQLVNVFVDHAESRGDNDKA